MPDSIEDAKAETERWEGVYNIHTLPAIFARRIQDSTYRYYIETQKLIGFERSDAWPITRPSTDA